jgi:hypothetical protein
MVKDAFCSNNKAAVVVESDAPHSGTASDNATAQHPTTTT